MYQRLSMKPGSLFSNTMTKNALALPLILYLTTNFLTLLRRGPKQCILSLTHFSTTKCTFRLENKERKKYLSSLKK